MDARTIRALTRWNREFYERHADDFAATRERPWRGWERLVPIIWHELLASGPPVTLDILDVGCGNGRFGEWLLDHAPVDPESAPIRYLGIDASAPLVRAARARLGDRARVECVDVLGDGRRFEVPAFPRRFALVVLFGFLHHVPGRGCRERLLRELAGRLLPRGLIAATFWQFGAKERFRARIVDWATHNRAAGAADDVAPIDLQQLEPGDAMLAWGPLWRPGEPPGPRRYCHHADPDEARETIAASGLEALEWWREDGEDADLNLYVVARPTG